MTFNSGSELSIVAAQISSSQAKSAEIDAANQKAVLGSGTYDLGKQASEFILRGMLRAYDLCLLTEAEEDWKARKALATA